MGTLTISNPVWSLCGQIYGGLNTFRSLSRKIKREGGALLEISAISSTASPQTAFLCHFYFSLFHPCHSTCLSLSAVVTRPPQKNKTLRLCAQVANVSVKRKHGSFEWLCARRLKQHKTAVRFYQPALFFLYLVIHGDTTEYGGQQLTTAIKQITVNEKGSGGIV